MGVQGTQPMSIPVLCLFADTGGGHRSAALAVTDALKAEYPGVFAPLLYDPLSAPRSPHLLRNVAGLYGPIVRLAPWSWGAVYHASDSQHAAALLRRTWLRLVDGPVAEVIASLQPAVVLSFHPLTTAAAVRAVRRHTVGTPVVTVVTDLVTTHAAWHYGFVERIVVPSAAVRQRFETDGIAPQRCHSFGLPVGSAFSAAPLTCRQQQELRLRLGVRPGRFLVVLAGGAEGSGPIARNADAVTRAFDDVEVVAICGRNRRLEARLRALCSPRLTVKGFVHNMADWYRTADVVVTKAGPQTIAEATCCGACLLITSHLPGQERGNTELVVRAGAGAHTPKTADVVDWIARLKDDPNVLQAMRHSALSLSKPQAARQVASLVASLVAPDETRTQVGPHGTL